MSMHPCKTNQYQETFFETSFARPLIALRAIAGLLSNTRLDVVLAGISKLFSSHVASSQRDEHAKLQKKPSSLPAASLFTDLHEISPSHRQPRLKIANTAKSICRLPICLILFCVTPAIVYATDFYVDPEFGNDLNEGTASTKAWQTLSKVNKFPGFQYGDRVLLRSGGIWMEDLIIANVSGVASASRSFQVSTYGGTSKAVLFGGGIVKRGSKWTPTRINGEYKISLCHTSVCPSSTIFVVRNETSGTPNYRRLDTGTKGALQPDQYVVSDIVNGWRYLYYRPSSKLPSQYDFAYTLRQGVRISVPFVTIENITVLLGGYPWKDANIVAAPGADHATIRNCEAYFGFGYGVSLIDVTDSTVDTCVAKYNRGTGLYIQSELASSATGNTIRNSESAYNGAMLSDPFVSAGVVDRGGIAIQGSYNVIIDNVIHDNGTANNLSHLDSAIMATAAQDSEAGKVCCGTIARNLIYNSLREGIRVDGPSWDIHHNIVSRWGRSGEGGTIRNAGIAVVGLGASGTIKVNNNTVFSDEVLPVIGINFGMPSNGDTLRNMTVYNNIVYMPGNRDGIGIRINRMGFEGAVDYNLIDGPLALIDGEFPPGSNVHTINGNPLFANSRLNDFSLQSSSPAIDAGTQAYYTLDFFETAIPEGFGPDIGAAEYLYR